MPEIRTTSSTGGQKGTKLARFDLLPAGPLRELAEHYGVGASKYADNQWRQGYEWSKSIAAIGRHFNDFMAGKDYDVCSNDPDGCSHVDTDGNPFVAVREDACFNHTGSHHMAAVAWHSFLLLEFKDAWPEHDDRYRPEGRAPSEAERTIAYLRQELERETKARKLLADLVAEGGPVAYSDEDLKENAERGAGLSPLRDDAPGEQPREVGALPSIFEIQDEINRSVGNLVAMSVAPKLFKLGDPPKPEDLNIDRIWQVPDVEVEWRNPEPSVLENVKDALRKLRAEPVFEDCFRPLPRFTVDGDGKISDARRPLAPREDEMLEEGWELVAIIDDSRFWANPTIHGHAAFTEPETSVLGMWLAGPDLLSKRRPSDFINESINPA